MLSREQTLFYEENGFLILENFISASDIGLLKNQIQKLSKSVSHLEEMSVFKTGADRQLKDRYFLESGNKIRFFLEENSQDFNKCGHALHELDPVFSGFSKSEKIQAVLRDLGLMNPYIAQSMYIFKKAGVGGAVDWHQDATFLYTEPNTLLGLWFALDEASRENGCLWAIPGGHRGPLRSRFRRVGEGELGFTHFDKPEFEIEKAVPIEVSQGSLVILHSLLPHMSEPNRSSLSRHAYTLHVFDRSSSYAGDNWLSV